MKKIPASAGIFLLVFRVWGAVVEYISYVFKVKNGFVRKRNACLDYASGIAGDDCMCVRKFTRQDGAACYNGVVGNLRVFGNNGA